MICIRADGGSKIGLGHIMRCISIATAMLDAGEEVCFIMADESAKVFLEDRGLKYHILGTDYRQMESEAEKLIPVLEQENPGLILVDSYQVTENYLRALGEYAPVAYLDDMGKISYPLDVIINYNIFAAPELYQNRWRKVPVPLLGTEYAPLRPEFQNVEYRVRDKVQAVLITTGGSDKFNLAGRFLDAILERKALQKIDCYVVSGVYNSNLSYLEKRAKEKDNVHICQNVANMCELMKKCDIAVTAGGSTMYELSAVGVPMLCFSFVDNQEQIVRGFEEKNLVAFAGDYLKQHDEMIRTGVEALQQLAEDLEARKSYSRRLREAVDGKGASRIAAALIRMIKSEA